jgi:hypothetical protein
MALNIFTCLLNNIKPELIQIWLPTVRDILYMLREDKESLQKSPKYGEFLKGLSTRLVKTA